MSYEERFKKENIILVGLWFGEQKPIPNMYLSSIYDEIMELRNGIEIETPDVPNMINVKGIIICGTCDLPAKALLLNMKQYNGSAYLMGNYCYNLGPISMRSETLLTRVLPDRNLALTESR